MLCITKEDPHGIVPKYSPWGLTFGDMPQIAAYRNKLLVLLKLCLQLSQTCDIAKGSLLYLSVDLLNS